LPPARWRQLYNFSSDRKKNANKSGRYLRRYRRLPRRGDAHPRNDMDYSMVHPKCHIRKGIGFTIRCLTLQDHKQCSASDEDATQNGSEGELLMEQYCGQDDGDHDAELIDGDDL